MQRETDRQTDGQTDRHADGRDHNTFHLGYTSTQTTSIIINAELSKWRKYMQASASHSVTGMYITLYFLQPANYPPADLTQQTAGNFDQTPPNTNPTQRAD